jgi:hypothetical protein
LPLLALINERMSNPLSTAPKGNWTETVLWQVLSAKEEDPSLLAIVTFLNRWMPKIETILMSAGTSPGAFTLHDAGHSFRVAQRMAEIIPSDVLPQLSAYEIALLLLAAYLHDIGMTPEERKVTSHYEYLLTGQNTSQRLTEPEIATFQQWLDDDERGLTPPLVKGKLTSEKLHLAAELVTYYCRDRHNDWSAEWIRNNLTGESLGSYAGWLDDLILLCSSHHYAKKQLLEAAFDPRPVGSPPVIIHLRYLACILRIADILEFDPERTPEVILRHRDIPAESLIYWWKNHAISMLKEGDALSVSARPSSAKLHRAIETMIDQIDHELQTCRSIADETHFENCPNLQQKLPHRWGLEHAVRRDLRPKEGAYEYIDGAFRPNTQKLLQLLSGTQLYHDPTAAVRELLQNAFDAVKEQIAYQRLASPNPADQILENSIRKLHRVSVRVERRSDGAWLVCRDTGVGMTKAIINNHLLVSGRARRRDIIELARRCRQAGFNLGRTGEFGIGVLSYFMIADRVMISTRRTLEPGDADPTGWRFETEGVGSFGDLRRDTTVASGSCVELHLKGEIAADLDRWFLTLRSGLKDIIRYAPCEIQLAADLEGCTPLVIRHGWAIGSADITGTALKQFRETDYNQVAPALLSERDRQEREDRQRHFDHVRSKAISTLHSIISSGNLPDGLGKFRLHLPYFELPEGAALAFLRVREADNALSLAKIGRGVCFYPEAKTSLSWKGMLVKDKDRKLSELFDSSYGEHSVSPVVEIDFESDRAGSLSVDRAIFSLSGEGITAGLSIRKMADKLAQDFVVANCRSAYATLNRRLVRGSDVMIREPRWFAEENTGESTATWKKISFPAVTSLPWIYTAVPPKVNWNGQPVDVLHCLRGLRSTSDYDGVPFIDEATPPDRVVLLSLSWRTSVAPLWLRNPFARGKTSTAATLTCPFPPSWTDLCGVHFTAYSGAHERASIWNEGHRIVQQATPEAWKWLVEQTSHQSDPLTLKVELLSDRGKASAWILNFILRDNHQLWDGICERDQGFLWDLWHLLFGDVSEPNPASICLWVEDVPDSRLRVVNPNGWSVYNRKLPEIEKRMPNPGNEWCLEGPTQEQRSGSSIMTGTNVVNDNYEA